VLGIAAGYEDLNDHDALRKDPLWGATIGKLTPKRRDCAALAGKSTLNRLEWARANGTTRYQRIELDSAAIERLFVELFLEAHTRSARGDRARSRCHGRSASRQPGRPLLPPATTTTTATCRSTFSAAVTC